MHCKHTFAFCCMLFCVILLIEGKGRPITCRNQSRWLRCLTRGSAAARLLGLWVRILPGACLSLSCECCVLSKVTSTGQSLVQRIPTEYSVSECDLETSTMRKRGPTRAIERGGGEYKVCTYRK